MRRMNRRVLIAGGGIGGLTAALCCARQGLDVDVFEQATAFAEVGAGIQLSPNCSRVLHALGLAEDLDAVSFLPEGTEMRHWRTGRLITSNPLGRAMLQTYGAPYYHIHRADLMAVLVNAAEADPRIRLHASTKLKSFEQDADSVQVATTAGPFSGSLLIGADGIHSAVRASLFGVEAPTFTGNVAWRALVPAERLPDGLVRPVTGVWWGPHKHFVHYFVRGGALVNCVCVVEKGGWEVESWTERGDQQELAADFAGWHHTIRTLIGAMDPDACFRWALFDRPPMSRWGQGRVTLLGDACHPTLPFMAQGAAMAIEDAAVLARCVAAGNDVAADLARYEGLRRDRTARVQQGSRRNARVFHLTGIPAALRNRAAGRAGSGLMDWLYRYDALSEPVA